MLTCDTSYDVPQSSYITFPCENSAILMKSAITGSALYHIQRELLYFLFDKDIHDYYIEIVNNYNKLSSGEILNIEAKY